MVLMTLLYSARAARYDLFYSINWLAKRITRWDDRCDRRLHRMMCYIFTTSEYKRMGYIGDDPEELTTHCYADANFAGCPYTLLSTTGQHHAVQGPNSRFPWAAASGGQTCLAQSTPEAEIVAMNSAMKDRGEASLSLWNKLMKQYHKDDPDWKSVVYCHEDNTVALGILETGINKTMKTLERGFGVDIAWCHKKFTSGDYKILHTRSSHMAADIYTKGFGNPNNRAQSM